MAADVEVPPNNPCCIAWKKKYLKLGEKYSKLEACKNQFRDCLNLVQKKYDVVEKENMGFKQATEELKVQVSMWKDEKEKESGIRIDLEDEVSALNDEIQLLKQNGQSASQQADEQLQERLNASEKEIKRMEELLVKERKRADLEKKKAEMERKKVEAALKNLEMEKNRVSEAHGVVNIESKKMEVDKLLLEKLRNETDSLKVMLDSQRFRAEIADKKLEQEKQNSIREKKRADLLVDKTEEHRKLAEMNLKRAEESKLLWVKLKMEVDAVKSTLASERSKCEAAGKRLEAEKQKTIKEKKRADSAVAKAEEQRKLAEMNFKKAEESKLLWEKLKIEADAVKSMLTSEKSKCEAAVDKKVEAEKQKTAREKRKADLAVSKAEEQRNLAEANLKKAIFEKDRADDLYQKLEEERNRAKKLEEELRGIKCSRTLVEAHADRKVGETIAELTTDVCKGLAKSDKSRLINLILEKEQEIIREKSRADSETKKAKKEKKVAQEYKKMATEKKHQADLLSKELDDYKLKFHELWEELQELLSYQRNFDNPQRCSNNMYETDTVKLLKKQLKLEKMLTKHAKKEAKLENFRNNMHHQELYNLKQELFRFQQRLDTLDDSSLHDGEGRHNLEKMNDQTFAREKIHSDRYQGQFTSGTDSRLDPPCRGFKRHLLLSSSAINSSSASFSHRSLVRSPKRGNLSAMASAEPEEGISNLKPNMSRLSDKMSMRHRSPSVGEVDCCGKKIFDAVESIENLYSKGHKLQQRLLSQLHSIHNSQKDEPAKNNLLESSYEKHARPSKRRKTSYEGTVVTHPLCDTGEPMHEFGNDDSDVMKFAQCPIDGGENMSGSLSRDFDDIEHFDYMKLLDLDNPADEQSYRRVIGMPLSPTLPEIEFYWDEELESDNPEMVIERSFQNESSSVRDSLGPKSSFNDINIEKKPINLTVNDIVTSELQREKDYVDFSKNKDFVKASNALCHQLQVSDISVSGREETDILLYTRTVASAAGGLMKFLVISSDNKDSQSILRILQTISSCMPQCSLLHSADVFFQGLLHHLLNAEDLSTKEMASVFFTMTLHKISEVGAQNLTNISRGDLLQSLSSTTLQILSAFSNVALRKKFLESCDVFELLALIEDFLLHRKVLFFTDVSAETQTYAGPKINLVLNGNAISLSELAASLSQLVSAGTLLASLCSKFDHISFLCETSCNIFTTHKFDPDVVLAILHAFSDTCGSKYFTLHQYNLPMTVVKSCVMFLEKQILSSNTPSKICPCCTNCPFSKDALSMEDIASLLLKNLRIYCRSVSSIQGSCKLENSLVPRIWTHEDRIDRDSGMRDVVPLSSTSDEDLARFTDILSLIEIVATFMGWDWTNDNIVGQLCELLESCPSEGYIAVIIVHLSQLGRLGVDARGYEDIGIKKLREWLSALLSQTTFSKLSLFVQFAIIAAFFVLNHIKLEDVENKNETPDITSQLVHANLIWKWFSQLNKEQQSFFRLQQAATKTNCRIGFS